MTADSDRQEPTTTKAYGKARNSADGLAHFNRAIDWLRLSEWDKARADLSAASERGFDVAAAFIETYKSAGKFEEAMDIELPEEIADILDPISEEEDAAFAKAIKEGLGSEPVSRECIMAILRGGNAD